MATTSPPHHYPGEVTTRPRGILKNPSSTSTQRVPQVGDHLSPERTQPDTATPLDEKELTLQNTLQNAGRRRSSVDPVPTLSRRRSSAAADPTDEANQRLKWDEMNLYLAEQNRTATMKITEPKTPYAKQYDPTEDDTEMVDEDPSIQVDSIVVDEKEKVDSLRKNRSGHARESDIPGLELGEPEEAVDLDTGAEDDRIIRTSSHDGGRSRSDSAEKHVSVGEDDAAEAVGMPSKEDLAKHKKFEEMRKKHYEMKNVKGLLGHPEDLIAEDEDEEEDQAPPPVPSSLPSRTVNGGS
ncbi:putative protein phosphatase inhibitor 2 (ipp-2) [Phaeomoniella chlamydospora]|uniref:Glc8 protein n=1 Tax=Phaeomoniella chlamydospora TaxID=158046 RepID=A0A0G2EM92_PHACM|nr:putative protein phosphatase inhibitor 2 (ipp-2) [Phaeomoniella chlamydospora]